MLSDSERIERQRDIVAQHIAGENAHDWPAVYDTFAQDGRAYYEVVPMQATYSGMEGVREFYAVLATALPDLHIDIRDQYDTPGCSIVEVLVSGTHRGPFFGLAPSGRRINIDIAGFYIFNEDSSKLLAEKIYYDQLSVFAQMPMNLGNSLAGLKLLMANRRAQQRTRSTAA